MARQDRPRGLGTALSRLLPTPDEPAPGRGVRTLLTGTPYPAGSPPAIDAGDAAWAGLETLQRAFRLALVALASRPVGRGEPDSVRMRAGSGLLAAEALELSAVMRGLLDGPAPATTPPLLGSVPCAVDLRTGSGRHLFVLARAGCSLSPFERRLAEATCRAVVDLVDSAPGSVLPT